MSKKYKFADNDKIYFATLIFLSEQEGSRPIQLIDNKMAHQKLEYIHNNPVEAGFVTKAEQ